jgi:hypothetical protein
MPLPHIAFEASAGDGVHGRDVGGRGQGERVDQAPQGQHSNQIPLGVGATDRHPAGGCGVGAPGVAGPIWPHRIPYSFGWHRSVHALAGGPGHCAGSLLMHSSMGPAAPPTVHESSVRAATHRPSEAFDGFRLAAHVHAGSPEEGPELVLLPHATKTPKKMIPSLIPRGMASKLATQACHGGRNRPGGVDPWRNGDAGLRRGEILALRWCDVDGNRILTRGIS